MQNIVLILIAVLVGGFVSYFLFGKKKDGKTSDTGLNLILTQINELSRTVDNKLGESHNKYGKVYNFILANQIK